MKFSSAAIAASLASLTLAAPTSLNKRATPTDADVLNYALTLEHLEATFYAQALQNYTEDQFASAGYGGQFYQMVQTLACDEATHVSFLTSALTAAGASPVAACNYNFGVTNVHQFVALASVLEGVGVSAYLGAAQFIKNKDYLTAAASILTVEARHNAYIRNKIGELPFPNPFDTPLDLDEVYTLAAQFISSCPSSNVALPVKAFPTLSILNVDVNSTTPIMAGTKIYLITAMGSKLPKNTYAAWPTVTGPIFTPVMLSTNGQSAWTTVPSGISGQTYVVLTKGNTTVTDNNILAGPAIVEVGDIAMP